LESAVFVLRLSRVYSGFTYDVSKVISGGRSPKRYCCAALAVKSNRFSCSLERCRHSLDFDANSRSTH